MAGADSSLQYGRILFAGSQAILVHPIAPPGKQRQLLHPSK
jgi:hypothetical protein